MMICFRFLQSVELHKLHWLPPFARILRCDLQLRLVASGGDAEGGARRCGGAARRCFRSAPAAQYDSPSLRFSYGVTHLRLHE